MAESGHGKIDLFEDFAGPSMLLASTADGASIGPFHCGGEGIEDADAGIVALSTDGLSGVARLVSGNTDKDTTFVGTSVMFDPALNGPLTLEARVRLGDLDDKQVYIGFLNSLGTITTNPTYDLDLETDFVEASTTTVTFASGVSGAGFLFSSTLTDDNDWHGIHAGGTTANSTVSTAVDLDDDAVAGEFQIFKIIISTNGTAWWYIDGVLKQTVTGAVSTTTDLAGVVAVSANTTEFGECDVDYLWICANRDWTV